MRQQLTQDKQTSMGHMDRQIEVVTWLDHLMAVLAVTTIIALILLIGTWLFSVR